MPSSLHQIKSRKRESALDFSLIEQFELDAGEKVSSQIIIDERIWHPYTIDVENQALVFLDMPADIDLSQETFIYPRQFEEATRLLLVPFSDLMALSKQVRIPENITFIFSIGRCGSTLLHQIFNQIEGVSSYSEPDPTTTLSLHWQEQAMSEAPIGDIVEATTKLQIHALTKSSNHVVLKFRGQVSVLMPYYFKRFPNANHIFMYRNPLNWARSMFRFLRVFFQDDNVAMEVLNFITRIFPSEIKSQISNYVDVSKEHIHIAELIALMLVFQLEDYHQNIDTQHLFALHYEDMLDEPEAVLGTLLDYCGIPQSELSNAMKSFEHDSQEGTEIARDSLSQELDSEGEQLFLDVMSKSSRIKDIDFRL